MVSAIVWIWSACENSSVSPKDEKTPQNFIFIVVFAGTDLDGDS